MSAAVEIHEGGNAVDDFIEGEGWDAALCLSWAQIVEGSATCEHCNGPASVVLATGADPDYAPLCWEAASNMIGASLDLGTRLFGER